MASPGPAKTGTVPTWVLASLRLLTGWSAVVAVPDGSPAPWPRCIPGFGISQTVVRFYTSAMTFPGTTTPGTAENSWRFTAAPPGGDHVPAVTVLSSGGAGRPRSWTRVEASHGTTGPRSASVMPAASRARRTSAPKKCSGEAPGRDPFGGHPRLLSCRSLPRSFGLCQCRSGIAGSNLMPSLRRRPACPGARPCPGDSSLDTACASGST